MAAAAFPNTCKCPRGHAQTSRKAACLRAPLRCGAWRDSKLRHVVDSREFDTDCMNLIFDVAEEMEKVKPGTPESRQLAGYCMATLFYEPSTRTRLSFEAAMGKLGGVILSTESAGEFSSAAKGETLEGTALWSPACSFHKDTARCKAILMRPCRHCENCGRVCRLPGDSALFCRLSQCSSGRGVKAHH
jgi:hypothetical protein